MRWFAIVAALGCAGVVSACDTSHPLPGSDIVRTDRPDASLARDVCATPGHEGCPCSEAGAEVECGKIAAKSGEYVTCSMGHSKCDGTAWGTCTGNRIVASSLPGLALGMGGLHPESTSGPCTDPCDPYTCTTVTGSTTDVTDPNVVHSDAGLSIQVGTQPSGPSCYGLFCQRQTCAGTGITTTISGTVYDPAQKNPLYNAFVYIPVDPAAPLPAFSSGASCDTCAGAGTLTVVALDQTGADGKFTLNNVPVGTNIPLVVQMGQWRRKIIIPSIQACVDNPLPKSLTHLPRNRFDGDGNTADIPKMAIASGSADPFECMLLKAGIDPAEIDVPGKGTRIEYYKFNGKDRDPGGAPAGATLTSDLNKLKSYDVVILPCEGGEKNHNADAPNLVAYANAGGRVFATHYSYSWLATPSPAKTANNMTSFYGTANWVLDVGGYNDPMPGIVDQTFPKGAAFAQWLQNIGATTTLGQETINEPRRDASSSISPASQRWMYGWAKTTSHTLDPDMLLSMTFNTPVGAAAASQCGRVVFSDFHVSADALVTGTCKKDSDCGYGATCSGAVVGACTSYACGKDADCPSTFYTAAGSCTGAQSTGTCTPTTCAASADCGNNNCQGTHCECTTGSGQCGSALCGGYCSAKACALNTDCVTNEETCAGAVTGSCGAKTCTVNGDCGTSGVCTAGQCQCTANAACGSGTCTKPPLGACTAKACYDTGCGASEGCTGTSGSCGAKACTASSQCGSGTCVSGFCTCTASNQCKSNSCSVHTYKSCGVKACTVASDCKNSEVCGTNGFCQAKTCVTTTDCGTNASCVGGKCACTANAACGSNSCKAVGDCVATACVNAACGGSEQCNGAVAGSCAAKICAVDADCGGGRCVTGKCTCGVTADCGSASCTLPPGSCTAKTCTSAATSGCGAAESCAGATAGACTSKTCTQNSDCVSGLCYNGACECTKNSTCGTGRTCIGRECVPQGCAYKSNCGSSESCIGGTAGVCKRGCTTDVDCPKGVCSGGQCVGCYQDADCPSSTSTCSAGALGTCTPNTNFPQTCKQGSLSAQEAALEFMLFDLTACVSPDSGQPPVPPITLNPVTFTLDFAGMCDAEKTISWRELDWQGKIPSTSSIVFSAQTGDTVADFATAQSTSVATATSNTAVPTWDVGLFSFPTASPPIASKNLLRITVTLNPTSDKRNSPSLSQWRVLYDCKSTT